VKTISLDRNPNVHMEESSKPHDDDHKNTESKHLLGSFREQQKSEETLTTFLVPTNKKKEVEA
jgi:hypothetical protein